MDTLAFDYAIPAIRACSGLAPVRQCSCRAYKKNIPIAAATGMFLFMGKRLLFHNHLYTVYDVDTALQALDAGLACHVGTAHE